MPAIAYPAYVAGDPLDGYTIRFRDLPEAISGAQSLSETGGLARDALSAALEARLASRDPIPLPTAPREGDTLVAPPLQLALKAMILQLMQRTRTKPGRLAELMDVSPS
jgi:antitoxin HicB